MKRSPLASAVALAVSTLATLSPAPALSQDAAITPEHRVIISAKLLESYPYRMESSSDSAILLAATPGYAVAASGGVSGLPVLNGLADDRLKIRVGALELTSACANHMNPPMSYIDPKQVQSVEVSAGVTPVSNGGDSIGGTISIAPAVPVFARPGAGLRTEGSVSFTGRSINRASSLGVSAAIAGERLSVAYDASYARAHSYRDGQGRRVLGSLYQSVNQGLTMGLRAGGHRLTLRAGTQHIPYQGFPNQYMDMTDNTGRHATLVYAGQYDWGELDASLYWQRTEHEMGFFSPERPGRMPMLTEGRNHGYTARLTVPLDEHQLVRLGHELHGFRLDDVWPAVPGSMMMGPQSYVNIQDGRRDRLALFGEVVTHHGAAWITQLGLRHEWVRSDAGAVQPYASNMMNAADAAAAAVFNARPHARRDGNLDLTASARWSASASSEIDFAYGRKTRSPNLYERYAWGRGSMAMSMTNWFGDGNGYVGDIGLAPEVAHTVSLSAHWHGQGMGADSWFVKLSPWYNRVADYIDVDSVGAFAPYGAAGAQRALLRFANHDARLYGVNLSWKAPLPSSAAIGTLQLSGIATLSRGSRADGGALYRLQPPTATVALEQRRGAWTSQLDLKAVARKSHVDARRMELQTAGYALVNARAAYQARSGWVFTLGASNLLDRAYADPLGGVYLSGLLADKRALVALPGYGRSLDLGVSLRF